MTVGTAIGLAILFWACCNTASAQQARTPAMPPASAQPSALAPRVEETQPSIYYLPDKQGNLQPVLDFPYQDFVDLYKLKNQLGQHDQPPRFSLQRMSVSGTVKDGAAELTFQFQILVRDGDWVRVPLRLDQGLLLQVLRGSDADDSFVNHEGEGVGYVCWIRGKPETTHAISLTLLVPLDAAGEETRWKLPMPRSTASELKFSAPMAEATATVSNGATLLSSAAKDGATEFNVIGLGGDFQLSWRKGGLASEPLLLEAVGTVLARLDGRSISTEATLSVRSHGAPFDRFVVRLPQGAELSPEGVPGYAVTPLEPEHKNENGAPKEPRRVEIRLPKKTTGPIEVRLNCRREHDPAKDRSWCDLAGFEVLGAARQWGTMTVATGGEWQVVWGPSRDARQIDQAPESLRPEDVVASFEYSCQPYSLPIQLTPRRTRINILPEYVIMVERDQIRLEGKLFCAIRGAKASVLEMALPGWELDDVGPDGLVADEGEKTGPDTFRFPLLRPMSGPVELQFRAHRAIEPGAKSIRFPLPRPQGGTIGPATVAVAAADEVELTPNNQHMDGLIRQRTPLPIKLPARLQTPWYYRSTGNAASFSAEFRVHPRRISVEAASHITLADGIADVEQKFFYTIAYEPVEELTLAVPRSLAEAKKIRILCDGKPLTPWFDEETKTRPMVSLRLPLSEMRIGRCELELHYSMAAAEPPPGRSVSLSLPLTMPEEGELSANRLDVKAEGNIRVASKNGVWSPAERGDSDSGGSAVLPLKAARRTSSVDLDLRAEAETMVVDRAWIQTLLSASARQDRAVYQFTTRRKELEIALPAGASTSQAVVLVDGKKVDFRTMEENRLVIPLAGRRSEQSRNIELRYHFPGPRPPQGDLTLDFPRFGVPSWMRRVYWQFVLPTNEHLISNPDGFTSEFHWGWADYFWGRQPLLDQEQLESWSGAASRAALPERMNQYLFSSLGAVDGAVVHTAGRTWIVLWASGAALVAGLLLIYVPASRHPATLFAAGIALLATGLISPEPTLLMAQAASLGLMLTLLAGLLERRVSRRYRIAALQEPSSHRIEAGASRTNRPYSIAISGNSSSTRTLAAMESPPPGDGQP
jgi:hypothetical protein